MVYYNLHTHRHTRTEEEVAIHNLIIPPHDEQMPTLSPGERYSCGIHPWHIGGSEEQRGQMERLRQLAAHPGVVAIGEVGLDKSINTPLTRQQEVFMEQVRLSEELRKPLIIHCVKAWQELIACRKLFPHQTWIVHGFRGNKILAEQLLRAGLALSFGEHFQPAAVQAAWPDALFVETDESRTDIRSIYHALAGALALPEELLVQQVSRNFSCF